MPSLHVHAGLAKDILGRWSDAGPAHEDFAPSCQATRNAFLLGAFGPDLGYFPGGCRLLSDLAHCVRSGALTRQLLRTASSNAEACFAAGWLSHVLADLHIHPLVARAVGALVYGDGAPPLDGASAPAAHVRVETGLDAWLAHEWSWEFRVQPAFDGSTIGFLHRAFEDVYGISFDRSDFLRSQRAIVRGVHVGGPAIGWLGRVAREERMPVSRALTEGLRAVRGALASFGIQPLTLAFLDAEQPSNWLLDETRERMADLPGLVDRQIHCLGAGLEDFNLDTGARASSSMDHAVARELDRFLAWGPSGVQARTSNPSASRGEYESAS